MYNMVMSNKTCTKCEREQPEESFSLKRGKRNSRCKGCVREYYQRYYHDSDVRKESVKKAVNKYKNENKVKILAKRYGVSEGAIHELMSRYDGMCHICKVRPATAVDHCHRTNEVRGVLCHKHNVGLGWFEDDIDNLQHAIDYLAAVSPHPDKMLKG